MTSGANEVPSRLQRSLGTRGAVVVGLSAMLGRAISNKLVGGPDQWVTKTIVDIVRSVRKRTGASVKYVDGSLEFDGEPWMQDGELTAARVSPAEK